MTVVNLALVYTGLVLLPSVFNQAAFTWVLTVGLFNVAEGAISAVGGYVVFQAIKIRAPYLIERSNKRRFSASVGEK